MRKTALALSLGAVCIAILSGCKSRSKYKAPTTPHDKVSVALSGVESSLAKYKYSEKTSSGSKTRSVRRIGGSDYTGALADIAKLYSSNDSQGDKIDSTDFDQPPMIQLRCLRKVFESAGSNYSFGTKYYDTINGEVYFDIATGEKQTGEAYKYNYNFTLSLSIDIDSSDNIAADMSFEIELTKGETTLHTTWYTAMLLDYEMSKESPTYTLTMFSDNEESELTYLEYGNTYEYGFVDMKEGRLNEFRRFCYEINKRMVKDENHATFSDYMQEANLKAQITSSKWYKNADLRKISHPNTSKTMKFIQALFDKFGLNTSDVNGSAFINKAGTQNGSIKSIYQDFTNTIGQDIIYTLVTGPENREQVKTSIHVMDYTVSTKIYDISLSEDISLRTLFNGEEPNYAIWYFDKNEEALEQAEKLDEINFRLSIPYGTDNLSETFDNSYPKTHDHYLNLDTNVSELYKKLGKANYLQRNSVAYLFIYDGLLNAVLSVTLGEAVKEIVDLYYKGFFPEELVALGFLEYHGEDCLYEYNDDVEMILDISKTNAAELATFKEELETALWTKEVKGTTNRYTKLNASKDKIFSITFEDNATAIQKGNLRITYDIEDIVSVVWPRETIKSESGNIFDLVEPQSKNGYFVNDESLEYTIILKNFDETEKAAFIESLKHCGDKAETQGDPVTSINVLLSNNIYNFSLTEEDGDILFTYKPDDSKTYPLYQLEIEKEGDTEVISIPLNDEVNGYYVRTTLAPGNYKVKKHNLADTSVEDVYLSMEGYDLDCYVGKLTYGTKVLTVLEEVTVVFTMGIDQTNFLRLQDNTQNG